MSTPVAELLEADPAALDDLALTEAVRDLGRHRRLVDARLSLLASELEHRSRADSGHDGLAARMGARTPEILLQQLADTSKRDAQKMVRVGRQLTVDADPWLAPVGTGVAEGTVTIEKADAIRAGLGSPTADVAADDLADAAARLASLAPTLSAERLAAYARELRDDLDAAHVADRERMLRDLRFFSLTRRSDGMTRVTGLLDPASAAIVGAAYDAATSPRRGGPRFVDATQASAADALRADERTTEQIACDTFVDLIRVATLADPDRLLGAQRHSVRVLVTAQDLATGTGAGFFAGQTEAVSIPTVQAQVCDSGILPIVFTADGRRPLRLGRERRLFSPAQRDALAARDGGCRFPSCERPASWCEAHHIRPWSEGGPTDVDAGVLLCRHHHLLIHDHRWRIEPSEEHGFVVIPPPSRDPQQRAIPMPARSRVAARLARTS